MSFFSVKDHESLKVTETFYDDKFGWCQMIQKGLKFAQNQRIRIVDISDFSEFLHKV